MTPQKLPLFTKRYRQIKAGTFSSNRLRALNQCLFPCLCKICHQACSTLVCEQCQLAMPAPDNICYQCGEKLPPRQLANSNLEFCGRCISQPPVFNLTIAAYIYQGHAATLIQQFKFREDLMLARFFAVQISTRVLVQFPRIDLPDALIPIPLHPKRLKQRGFNQSYQLAKAIGKQLDIPVYKNCLVRSRATPEQSNLSRLARTKNIKGAFSIQHANSHDLKEKRLAIIDDVVTTGSTVREAAKTLQRAAPDKINVFAIAKTLSDRSTY